MKRALIFVLLVACPLTAKTDKRAEAAALFARAADLMDLKDKPILARGNVDIYVAAGKLSGSAEFARLGKGKLREEFHVGGYDEITITTPTQIARIRSAPFRPAALRTLFNTLLGPVPTTMPGKLKVLSVKDRRIDATTLRCVDLSRAFREIETYCFDGEGLLRHSESWNDQVDLDDFVTVDSVRVPRHIRASDGDNTVRGELSIKELSSSSLDDKVLLASPPNSTILPFCVDMIPPKPINTKDPEYTAQARQHRTSGTVILQSTIGTDGRAHDIAVAKTLPDGLDQQAIDAVSKWSFKPAMCGSALVPKEISIEVNFRLE